MRCQNEVISFNQGTQNPQENFEGDKQRTQKKPIRVDSSKNIQQLTIVVTSNP